MAYVWNVENYKLMNERDNAGKFWKGIFNDTYTTNRDDMVKFVDKYCEGKLTRILMASEKFNTEKEKLPKDSYGDVKTVSLIAWIKRNNFNDIIDTTYHYGEFYLFGMKRKFWEINEKRFYDHFDNIIDEAFNRTLTFLLTEERDYFANNDPYAIKFKEVKNNPFTGYVVDYGYSSDGKMWVTNKDGSKKYLGVEEFDKILEAANKIKTYADKIKKEFKF